MSLSTLLGVDDHPGEITGMGPVLAGVARGLVARQHRAEWRFAVLDAGGRWLFDGVTRHRPTGHDPTHDHPGQDHDGVQMVRPTGGQTVGGIVELHVPAALLAELAADPARFPQWAPLITDIARQHREQRPIVQDPGARFPGARLRRRIQIRFRVCTMPPCRHPARHNDQDHVTEHGKGGRTVEANLHPPCRHDHMLRTTGGWRVAQPHPGHIVWTSPMGRRHETKPKPISEPLPPPLPRDRYPADYPDDHEPDPGPILHRPPQPEPEPEPEKPPNDPDEPPPF